MPSAAATPGAPLTGVRLAASAGNGRGVAGLAYDAQVLPIRVLDGGGRGTFAATSSGYDYAGDLGLQVVNVSIGATFA